MNPPVTSATNPLVITENYLSDTSEKYLDATMTGMMQKSPVLSFRCRDIGWDCSFESTGTTKHKILRQFIEHAESSHNMHVLSAELLFKIQDAINHL